MRFAQGEVTESVGGSHGLSIRQCNNEPSAYREIGQNSTSRAQSRSLKAKSAATQPAAISRRERLIASIGASKWAGLAAGMGMSELEKLIASIGDAAFDALLMVLDISELEKLARTLQVQASGERPAENGLSLTAWRKKSDRAPYWAVDNWQAEIKARKVAVCSDETWRALKRGAVSDVNCLAEDFNPRPAKGNKAQVTPSEAEERTKHRARLMDAWKGFHPTWVADQAAAVVRETQPVDDKSDPFSGRSVRASLSVEQQKTWEVYRKLTRRKSGGTGRRKKGLSQEAIALRKWENRNRKGALVLGLFIAEAQPIGYVVRECGFPSTHGAVKAIASALNSLRVAVMRSKKGSIANLKCPRQLPCRNAEGYELIPDRDTQKRPTL
jgi:hypothetical protein